MIYFRAQHTLAHILFQTLGYRPSVSFVFQIFLDKFNFIGIRLLRLRLLSVLKFDCLTLHILRSDKKYSSSRNLTMHRMQMDCVDQKVTLDDLGLLARRASLGDVAGVVIQA